MASNKLKITQLDFDDIKTNLKNYLRTQDEFLDYDFEGSGLSVLLDVLAYNTHYNAYYLNMVANESFLDTAILRDSVVSHAKTLGYTPFSKKCAKAFINVTIPVDQNNYGQVSLPRGFSFRSEAIDNTTYNFSLIDEYTATQANGFYYFENLPIYEGNYARNIFIYDPIENPKSVFDIPDKDIDIDTLQVLVRDGLTNTFTEQYNLSSSILNIDGDSKVYFIQETLGEKYQIYFGNDIVGKSLQPNDVVIVSYLVTSGSAANKVKKFVAISKILSFNTYSIQTVSEASGGANKEGIESVRLSAISQYTTQNRLVNKNDYLFYVKQKYPVIDSISVWGGEEQFPKVYGKIFVCLKPTSGYYLSEIEKKRILDDIIAPMSVVSITPELVDPEVLFILVSTIVYYNRMKTTLTGNQLNSLVTNKIKEYNTENLNDFDSTLVISRLQDEIDNSDTSIIGNDVTLRLQKRFSPILNKLSSYTIKFNAPLKKLTSTSKLTSSQFTVRDSSYIRRDVVFEEIPDSETGVSRIVITDSGVGYTTAPTVRIEGDGYGATATAKISGGRIESISVDNRGINYSKAVVYIDGGGGVGGTATAIVDSKIGELRTVYFDNTAKRVVVNDKIGIINYNTGEITINNINILKSLESSGEIKITVEAESGMISSTKNTLLYLDETDPSSIQVTVHSV